MIKPESLPICMLRGDKALEHLIAIDLPADLYTLDELRQMVSVLEKYKAMCELVDQPAVGGVQ